MIKYRHINIILIVLTGILFFSCSPSRYLGPKEYLLTRNKVSLNKPIAEVSEFQGFIQQKPNRSFLGMARFRIWAFQYASKNKETHFKRWLLRSVADRPVVLDTHLCNVSSRHMKTYLNNIGYFHAGVTPEYRFRRKFAKVNYKITVGSPYLLRSIKKVIADTTLRTILLDESENSLIQLGDVFNAYTLDKERDRITALLRNKGYFLFSKDYITYRVDSIAGKDLIDITLMLSNPANDPGESPIPGKRYYHRTFNIRKVQIFTDYDPMIQRSVKFDSLEFLAGKRLKENLKKSYTFFFNNSLNIRPKAITQNLFMIPGELFRIDDVDQTYTRLSDLQFYRFVNIDFVPIIKHSALDTTDKDWLDCRIQLSRNKLSALSTGAEGTNNGGDFGLAANVVYENRNLFHGAELLNIKLKGAMEVQKRFGELYNNNSGLFNTFETGIQANVIFPKFFIPINQERFSRYFRPKTTINAGFNFQSRSSYKRYLMEISYGYEWRESQTKRHILYPVEINSVSIFPDTSFTNYLNTLNDNRLTDQYTDHLIMALKYSYIYNNQKINKKANFNYFRGNFESAGNLLSAFNDLAHSQKDENGQYGILNIKYAQFLKIDGDFRHYYIFGPTTLVYRASVGFGYAYGNSSSLPFDKGFYSGGANGMRGWAIRSLGPGGYNDVNTALKYDKMGDIFLETNLEFRFPIIGWFTGAAFTDVGNIWLLKPNDQFPDGDFQWDIFYRQIALDGGLGFRLDFSFFVFRLDGALQFRNPALPEPDRWINVGKINPTDIMWNFGIGYPF